MPDIGWICLSDMHFGAENSLLSNLPAGTTEVDVDHASPVLQNLVECLAAVVATNEGPTKPSLVLNGDILEMALAEDNVAAMVFDRFIDLAFTGREPIFNDTIIYLAGNHDHHLWETARERQYSDYVGRTPPNQHLGTPWHATRLFASGAHLQAELLTALVRRRAGDRLTVDMAYPNHAIGDASKVVVFHHGHFIESLYRLMSTLRSAIFPGQVPGPEVWEWEADNFAWIDFFWSSLGRSGQAGQDVGLIYDCLQEPASTGLLASNLASAAVGRIPHLPAALRPSVRAGIRPFVKWAATRVLTQERSRRDELLSPSAEKGLDAYLRGPLKRQLESAQEGSASRDVSFVFGHTHKPFERVQRVEGFDRPVSIYNSGGWVVDTPETKSLQGASVILVDTSYDVGSLRIYNQAETANGYRVTVGPQNSALAARLKHSLDLTSGPWVALSESVAEAVQYRHQVLPEIIRRGLTLAHRPASA